MKPLSKFTDWVDFAKSVRENNSASKKFYNFFFKVGFSFVIKGNAGCLIWTAVFRIASLP
jgi:hypothetical protein